MSTQQNVNMLRLILAWSRLIDRKVAVLVHDDYSFVEIERLEDEVGRRAESMLPRKGVSAGWTNGRLNRWYEAQAGDNTRLMNW